MTVDDKGRIAVPVRFRDLLLAQCEGRVVVTMYYDRQLAIYPRPAWEPLEAKLMSMPSGHAGNRALKEMLLYHADERQLDSQSRLLIAPSLRRYAGLERDAELVGQSKKLVLYPQSANERRYANWDRTLKDPRFTDTLDDLDL